MTPTLNHRMSEADLCRDNGWVVGTRLIGTEVGTGWSHTSTIEITAIGRENVLCLWDHASGERESLTTFAHRQWEVAP